ncbi:trypsin-3-like [Trichogramma pretiosum]|uniref:trypsin-3-like n=1 Tax=Trichogramma pretiosum TaxID=7493 RepID=UPI0006C9A358|nr:trypsin-3-like [Trichogramma pretiosum]
MASPAVTYRDGEVDLHLNPEEDGSLDAESDSSRLIGTISERSRSNIRSARFWRRNCYSIFGLSIFIIVCAVAIVRLAIKVSPSNAPEHGPAPEAITMGVNAKEGEFPYQALVYNNFTELICGGSIYNKRFIITAAHCVTDLENGTVHDPANIIVRVGLTRIDDLNAIERTAYKVHVHYLFGDPNYPYIADIALIEVKEDIIFNKKIQPIRLSKRLEDTKEGTPVTITGWGETWPYSKLVTMNLQVGKSVIVNFDNCSIDWKRAMNATTVRRTMFCMSPEQSSCYGDSGGPIVNKDKVQVGIVYYSFDCGVNTTVPSVATEIAPWRSWIRKTGNLTVVFNRELAFLNEHINIGHLDIMLDEMLHMNPFIQHHGNKSNIFNHTYETTHLSNRNATTGSATAVLNSSIPLDDVLNRRGPRVSIPRSYITPNNPGPFPAIDKKVYLKSVNMTAPLRKFLNPQPKPSQSRHNKNRGRLIMRLL